MTCRHEKGDPACGQYARDAARADREQAQRDREKLQADIYARTPDADKYQIIQVHRCGEHLVLKVRYPNCAKCAYEGTKVMVFLHVSEAMALSWRRIDPHFREQKNAEMFGGAPPPAARFPASEDGWKDAVHYALSKPGGR